MYFFIRHCVPVDSCMECAIEASKMVADANREALDQHLDSNGLKRFEVARDGHCILHSWKVGLLEAGVRCTVDDLLSGSVADIMNNILFYKEFLPNEDLEKQLQYYAVLRDYDSAVVDLMVYALANATCTTCIVLSVQSGQVNATKISPRQQESSKRTIRVCKVGNHYDAVLQCTSDVSAVAGNNNYTCGNLAH